MGEFPGVSTARRVDESRGRRKNGFAARSLEATILRSSLFLFFFLRRRIETRQIQQRVVELRQERPQRRGEVLRQLEEILEIPAQGPVYFRENTAS